MAPDDALRDRRLVGTGGRSQSASCQLADGPRPSSKRTRAPRARQNVEEDLTTTRTLPRVLTLGAATLIVVAACSNAPGASTAPTAATGGNYEQFKPDATLLAAAKAEGTLTTIALPHDWCNYGQIEGAAPNPNNVIDTFKARTGLAVNELSPLAGSGDEIVAIKTNKDNKGPQALDVVDVGLSFGP